MCLIIQKPAEAPKLTRELIDEVFRRNSDGMGVMFINDGQMRFSHHLPKDADDAARFFERHAANNQALIHWRQRTHGACDLANCHPYKVTPHIYMMHNGMLASSNPVYTDKSDTWHYIEYILKPALTGNPDLLLNEEWQKYVSKDIGPGNKFAFMRSDGRIVILNRDSGIEWEDCWFSNEYAWDVYKFAKARVATYYDSYYSNWGSEGTAARSRPFVATAGADTSVGTTNSAAGKTSVNYVDDLFDSAVRLVDLIDQNLTVSEIVHHHRGLVARVLIALKIASASDTARNYRELHYAVIEGQLNDALYEIAKRFSIHPLYSEEAL